MLEPFFVRDAETLLFVHNHQTEILKFHILREQSMRADDNVHLTVLGFGQDFLLLFGGYKAAQHGDPYGEGRKSLFERFEVLKTQNSGWRQNCHLLSVTDGL